MLPYLDVSVEQIARFVFVMAGSSGSNIGEMKQRIACRPKDTGRLIYIPGGNEYWIPNMGVADQVLVVLSQFLQLGKESHKEIQSAEKLGLYFAAAMSRLANARQLCEFAVRAFDRMPLGEDRIKSDHLLEYGAQMTSPLRFNRNRWFGQLLPCGVGLALAYNPANSSTVPST